jgi:hypothetical protein
MKFQHFMEPEIKQIGPEVAPLDLYSKSARFMGGTPTNLIVFFRGFPELLQAESV